MKSISQFLLIGMIVIGIVFPYYKITNRLIPIAFVKKDSAIEKNLHSLGAPPKHIKEISSAISMASKQTGISHQMITSLMFTESRFNPNAKSCLGYRGLMQIPYNVKYIDANVLIGTRIFKDKLELDVVNGDMKRAIIAYKGWPLVAKSKKDEKEVKEGQHEADKVIKVYRKLTEEV